MLDDARHAWTAEEDLRLLDGIITCGLGNWPDIAEHVNGGACGEGLSREGGGGPLVGMKSEKRCMERYLDDFLGRYGHILPPYTMVPMKEEENNSAEVASMAPESSFGGGSVVATSERKRTRGTAFAKEECSSAPGFKNTKFRVFRTEELDGYSKVWPHPYIPPNIGVKKGDEVGRDLSYRSEQYFIRLTANVGSKLDVDAIRREFIEKRAQNIPGYEAKVLPPRLEDIRELPGAELAGYMPRRGDFDMEWDNDAEKIIADMEFSPDDSKADQDLKLEVIRIFNSKLDEREKRRQFIIDRKLLNYRENQEKMWRLPPDERHLVHRMRLFARFHSHEEHEAFVQKMLEAKRLRKEIAKLQMYRRMGIKSLADAEKYELDKSRREYHRNAWRQKEAERKKAEADAARAAKDNAAGFNVSGSVASEGVLGAAASQSLDIWKQFKSGDNARKSQRRGGIGTEQEVELTGAIQKVSNITSKTEAKVANATNDQERFDIRDKPGFSLLSSKEVKLCKRLRLLPQQYLDVKKALLSESLAAGIWKPSSSAARGKQKSPFFTVDIERRENIIDFVLEAGWIPSRPKIVD